MVIVQPYPSQQLISYYIAEFREYIEGECAKTYEQSLEMLFAYFKIADYFLGARADKQQQEEAPKFPFALLNTQKYKATYYIAIIKEVSKDFTVLGEFENIEFAAFLEIHKRIISHVPQCILKLAFDEHMPGFLVDMLRQQLKHFPYIYLVDRVAIPAPLTFVYREEPEQFLITAPVTPMYENYIYAMNSGQSKLLQSTSLSLYTTYYQMLEQYNNYVLIHTFRTPKCYDMICSKARNDDLRKFVKQEYYYYICYENQGYVVGILNYLLVFDAFYFNELPDVSNYSSSALVTEKQEQQGQQPINYCTFYKCRCRKCRFLFQNEKYQSLQLPHLLKYYRERRVVSLKDLPNMDSFEFRFKDFFYRAPAPAVRIANYELTEQNERLQRFKNGVFSQFDIDTYSTYYPGQATFPFRIFLDNSYEYVQSQFTDRFADAFLKAEIMRLNLQGRYARRIEDVYGRKYELAELIKSIQYKQYGEINDAVENYESEIKLLPYLTEKERKFVSLCDINEDLFKLLKVHILRKIQLANCCQLSIIDISHYVPFSIKRAHEMMAIFQSQGEIPAFQRRNTVGPVAIPYRSEECTDKIVRTTDYRLLELYNVGVYQTVHNVFKSGFDKDKVAALLKEQPVFSKNLQLCDDIIEFYTNKYGH